jgi:SprT-like family
MLRTLTRLFGRGLVDPAQLDLPFAAAPPGDVLLDRLRALGLRRIRRCRLTRNRNVMVSFSGGELRVHEGYVDAPAAVLRAIVVFIEGRTRAERRAARRAIVAHPVRAPASPPRRLRTRPEDRDLVGELARWHERYNAEHFDGQLRAVSIRVSRRMRSRLGHYTSAAPGEPAELAISWRHIRRHGWDEALHTLLHEMVHQWQDETGHPIDHGRRFRAKARAVGIAPHARRPVAGREGAPLPLAP